MQGFETQAQGRLMSGTCQNALNRIGTQPFPSPYVFSLTNRLRNQPLDTPATYSYHPGMARPCTLPAPWRSILRHCGGKAGIAPRLGVNYISFWRWAKGHLKPTPEHRDAITRFCETHGIRSPFLLPD